MNQDESDPFPPANTFSVYCGDIYRELHPYHPKKLLKWAIKHGNK